MPLRIFNWTMMVLFMELIPLSLKKCSTSFTRKFNLKEMGLILLLKWRDTSLKKCIAKRFSIALTRD